MIRPTIRRSPLPVVALLALSACTGAPGQAVPESEGPGAAGGASVQAGDFVTVRGRGSDPLILGLEELRALPRDTARLSGSGEVSVLYEGTLLRHVLERAGVEFGPALRGPAMASYVVVDAADGYRVVFSLAELDAAFGVRPVLLVDRRDGGALEEGEGPLRIVVPGDLRGARGVRQVTGIRLEEAPAPPG